MKAAYIEQYGGTDAIKIVNDFVQPAPAAGQVLVKVHAASLNRIDTILRAGYLQQMMPLPFPSIVAGDFAGTVAQVGEGVTGFSKGDEVYGHSGALAGGSGALAEFTVAATGKVSAKPASVSMEEAASLPLTAASALQAIEEHIGLQEGQKILIHGGTGGIGAIAIQLAKHLGAFVATTVDVQFASQARELGADEVIDYKTQDFTSIIKDYDAVLVTAADAAAGSYGVLKSGGVLVLLAGMADENAAREHGITAIQQMTQTTAQQLGRIAELVDKGIIKPKVDKAFPFAQAKEAYDYFEGGHPKGKVVVTMD
ncbi:MAG TPA: NADP-dependent oxidoreductase [Chitinophagaceae bacterium]|jgi:NADPH:quinone reductase-like Zn-dependent oxidoreductase|nr:NADP-dependent oxidoreductase [Chitinophagaceae bacterium]